MWFICVFKDLHIECYGFQQWHSHRGSRGARVLLTAKKKKKNCQKSGKRGKMGKRGKKSGKRGKIVRKGKNQKGSFTFHFFLPSPCRCRVQATGQNLFNFFKKFLKFKFSLSYLDSA